MANFVLINKDEPAACQVWVADVDIPDEATATSITADHKYLKSLGNTLWSKDFSKGYTYESSGWVNIAGGGSTSSNIFYATYGTTTYLEVHDAILEGKIAIVYMKATVPDTQCETYVSLYLGPGDVSFARLDANSGNCVYVRVIKVLADNSWHQYDQIEYCEPVAGNGIAITKTLVDGKYKNVISLNLPVIQGTDVF